MLMVLGQACAHLKDFDSRWMGVVGKEKIKKKVGRYCSL
jgi:hypothetical protein